MDREINDERTTHQAHATQHATREWEQRTTRVPAQPTRSRPSRPIAGCSHHP